MANMSKAYQSTDSIPNQWSALVTGVIFPTIPVQQPNSDWQYKLSQEETTPHTGQWGTLVTGVTITTVQQLTSHWQYKLPQEETTPHTGQKDALVAGVMDE